QSGDGDIIDCVDIYSQPSLHHPAFRNHKIQLTPSYTNTIRSESEKTVTLTSQIWHEKGSCPEGTIPIRRTTIKNNAKEHTKFPQYNDSEMGKNNLLLTNHSMAILLTTGLAYMGGKGDIKVWNPKVESDEEYTTSRVALKSGPRNDFEAVESGWMVNPRAYGDRQTRLYVYWTADGSRKTGCFDLMCPGFIQTTNEIALGAAIYPISTPRGLPYQITIYIRRDPYSGNWWMQYGERINVGYWPPDLFQALMRHAETVQWGGEVFSARVGGFRTRPHTATEMGSGQFPDWILGTSGSVERMRILGNDLALRVPDWVSAYSDEYYCYGVFYVEDYVEEPEFFYGGPGRNFQCP
ncbi:hypothetical protein M569_09424, partial [Genlisea aurea]